MKDEYSNIIKKINDADELHSIIAGNYERDMRITMSEAFLFRTLLHRNTVNENLDLLCVMPPLLDFNFRQLRKDNGLTLREVEERTGLSNAYLSQLETGKIKSPSYETIRCLINLYCNGA